MPTGKYPRKDYDAFVGELPKVVYPLLPEEVFSHGDTQFECHLPPGVTWQSLIGQRCLEYSPETIEDRYSFKAELSRIDHYEPKSKTSLIKRRTDKLRSVSNDTLLEECKRRGLIKE